MSSTTTSSPASEPLFSTTTGAKSLLSVWLFQPDPPSLQDSLGLSEPVLMESSGTRCVVQSVLWRMAKRLDERLRQPLLERPGIYKSFEEWYQSKYYNDTTEKILIQRRQDVFLLYALLHIKDALDSLIPVNSLASDYAFGPAMMEASKNIFAQLDETYRPASHHPDQKQSRKTAKALAANHFPGFGNVPIIIERGAMWRKVVTQLQTVAQSERVESNQEETSKPNLRKMLVASNTKVVGARMENYLVRAACGIRWGYSGENMMKGGEEDAEGQNVVVGQDDVLTKEQVLPLDIAASIGMTALITPLSDVKVLGVGHALKYLELQRGILTDEAHVGMQRMLWIAVACMAIERIHIVEVMDIWFKCFQQFGRFVKVNEVAESPWTPGEVTFQLSLADSMNSESVVLVEPTLQSWRATLDVFPKETGKGKKVQSVSGNVSAAPKPGPSGVTNNSTPEPRPIDAENPMQKAVAPVSGASGRELPPPPYTPTSGLSPQSGLPLDPQQNRRQSSVQEDEPDKEHYEGQVNTGGQDDGEDEQDGPDDDNSDSDKGMTGANGDDDDEDADDDDPAPQVRKSTRKASQKRYSPLPTSLPKSHKAKAHKSKPDIWGIGGFKFKFPTPKTTLPESAPNDKREYYTAKIPGPGEAMLELQVPWYPATMGRYVDTFKAVLEHQQKDISERQVVLFDREVVSEHWPSQHNVCFLHESTVSAYPEIGPSNLWVNGNITRTVQDQSAYVSPEDLAQGKFTVYIKATINQILQKAAEKCGIFNVLEVPLGDMASSIIPAKLIRFQGTEMMTAWHKTNTFPGCIKQPPFDLLLWMIFGVAGATSRPHTDQHGMGTWVEIVYGEKIWTVVRQPTDKAIDFTKLQVGEESEFVKNYPADTYLLQPGSILTMPPGRIHTVVTTVDCVAIGGHFYSGHQMMQTMVARFVEHYHGSYVTNVEYHSAELMLHRMLIYAWYLINKASGDTGDSHQQMLHSPYPLSSLACLVHMCQHPELFVVESGEPHREQFATKKAFDKALGEWPGKEAEDRGRGMSKEFALQREAAKQAADQLEVFVYKQAEVDEGGHWKCLQRQIEDARIIDSTLRRIEEERMGRQTPAMLSLDEHLLQNLHKVTQEACVNCKGGDTCKSAAMERLRSRVDFHLKKRSSDIPAETSDKTNKRSRRG